MTTLQAVIWAGTARRIPRRLNSVEEQYVPYCALGQGCKDPEPLRPIRKCSVALCALLQSRRADRAGALFALSPRQRADRARYGGTS